MGGRIAAVVTGAGSGLGRDVALVLAARGCDVTIVDIDASAGESARRDCEAKGVTAHFIEADLLASGAAERIVGRAMDLSGSIGILVNNAGYGAGEAFLEMKEATWDRTLGLNLRALAMMCSVAGREMARQKSGRIVNITSPASRMALPNYTAYSASKAGVDAVTRAAAAALAPHGVRVNSVSPGMMDTPMQRQTERQFAALENRSDDFEAFLDERTRRIPIGRRLSTEEVAASVVWLALDAPDYITAERINASGGMDKD
ncbi:MAG TPA: SDR family oxidoreductase [Mycoplana sp.]|jgi:3-oxoacyl-[acyl-carrier protein] reductase|nr:SDR family oxidoreductase [Mycoplana sp.]